MSCQLDTPLDCSRREIDFFGSHNLSQSDVHACLVWSHILVWVHTNQVNVTLCFLTLLVERGKGDDALLLFDAFQQSLVLLFELALGKHSLPVYRTFDQSLILLLLLHNVLDFADESVVVLGDLPIPDSLADLLLGPLFDELKAERLGLLVVNPGLEAREESLVALPISSYLFLKAQPARNWYLQIHQLMAQRAQFAFDKFQDMPSKYPREEIQENIEEGLELGGTYQNCIYSCGEVCGTCKTYIPCICCVEYPFIQIDQSYVGLYQRFGRYVKSMGPGLQYFNPCTDVIQIIDVKTKIIDLAKQTAITRDNIMVTIDAAVYYNIVQPRHAHYLVSNIDRAVRELACSTLRSITGQYILQDLLQKRQEITEQLGKFVARHVHQWGIQISNILIKDILMSPQLQETLSAAAKERRLAESKIITAKADVESAKLMRQTADILSSKSAMQIRYLQTVKAISSNPACKIIFISADSQ